jgi:hypothetical protein
MRKNKNNKPVYYASIVINHCEGNATIFSGVSLDNNRLFNHLFAKVKTHLSSYTYPYDNIVYTREIINRTNKEDRQTVTFELAL